MAIGNFALCNAIFFRHFNKLDAGTRVASRNRAAPHWDGTMSTLLEMAEAIRLAEARQAKDARTLSRAEDVYTNDRIEDLCDLFETTPWGLCCALESVGSDPNAIGKFLRSKDVARFHNSEFAILI
jgi:hypothetical protein